MIADVEVARAALGRLQGHTTNPRAQDRIAEIVEKLGELEEILTLPRGGFLPFNDLSAEIECGSLTQ